MKARMKSPMAALGAVVASAAMMLSIAVATPSGASTVQYAKLASEAPNASSKSVLNAVVVVLKDYISSKSLPKLDAYIAANHAAWTKGTKALAAAIISCAKSLE